MRTGTLGPSLAATFVFCAIIYGVPVAQSVLEARAGTKQSALRIFSYTPPPRHLWEHLRKHLREYESQLEDKSWLVKIVRPRTQSLEFRWLQDAGKKATFGLDGWYFYQPGLSYLISRPNKGKDSTSQEAVAAIVDVRDQLAQRGIHLIVMPAPNKESIYPDRLTRRAAKLPPTKSPETEELFAGLEKAKVDVIDLFKLYADARSVDSAPLYLGQDSHWTPEGLERAAQKVAERIRQTGVTLKADASFDVQNVSVTGHGDVLGMLQNPLIEAYVAPETTECRQVIRRDDRQPYRDSPDSEVLILGDSFLRIFEEDEPGSAGFIAHLAKELSQPLASLVADGGASTLVRQELNRRARLLVGKKIVVWEFVERDIRSGAEGWQKIPIPAPPEQK